MVLVGTTPSLDVHFLYGGEIPMGSDDGIPMGVGVSTLFTRESPVRQGEPL